MDQLLAKVLQNPMYQSAFSSPERKKKLDFKILATYADGTVHVSINDNNYKYVVDTAYYSEIYCLYHNYKPGKALALLKKVARSWEKIV